MAQALVGFPRHTQDAFFTSSNSFVPEYPLSNCGQMPFAKVARTNEKSICITALFNDLTLIELVVICRHNILNNDAKWSVQVYDDAQASNMLFDTGLLDIWPAVKTESEVDWDGGNWWDRTYTLKEKENTPFYAPVMIPGGLYARRVDVCVETPTQEGAIDIGLIEIASALLFDTYPQLGAQHGFRSRSEVIESEGGTEYSERKNKPRVFRGEIPVVEVNQAKSRYFEFQRQADITDPFFWWFNVDDAFNTLRDSYMARHSDIDLMTYATSNYQSIPISFKEVL